MAKAKKTPKAAPRKKNAPKRSAAPKQEKAPHERTIVLIGESSLRALLKQDDNYTGRMETLNGELREVLSNAVDKKHLNKKAYAMLKKVRKIKSLEERAATYYTFLAYVEMSGDLKLIESVQNLPLEDDKGEGAGEEEPEEAAGEEDGEQFVGQADADEGAFPATTH